MNDDASHRAETSPSSAPPSPPTDAQNPGPRPEAPPPKLLRPSVLSVVLMIGVALIGIALIMKAWQLGPFNTPVETTDNAYVRGAVTVLAPQVSGYVTAVLVRDFEHVKVGQALVRIDDRSYAAAVAQAEAQLAGAQAQFSNNEQTQAQNHASLGSAHAGLAALEAEQARAQAELARVEELAGRGSVSLNERDKVRTTARLAAANVLKARADIDIAAQRIKATTVGRASLQAQVQMAEAQLRVARINFANTVVVAPGDGQVSEVSVRLGQYVAAGTQLLFLVPETLWVVANFKETQTGQMQVGQPARFKVDALGGAALSGRVLALAPATGSEFSVLRADNATGNFTKVVQRLPVRIAIDPGQALARRLRPGMSVEASVDTSAAPRAASEPAR